MKMKNGMKLAGVMFLAAAPLNAQEENPRVLQVVYEVFSLSQSEAAASQRESLTDREAYAKMLAGLEGGTVKQEKLQAIRTFSGHASSEHISEFIYATEYEPPELPNSVGVAVNSPAATKEEPSGKEVIDALKTGPGWSQGLFPATPSIGTAFETKNLGDTLEVEAITGGGDPVEVTVRLAASHVKLAGFEAWGQGLSEAKMPRFSVKRVRSGVTVVSGMPTLIGTVSPGSGEQVKDDEVRVWFAFVTATVVEVKE